MNEITLELRGKDNKFHTYTQKFVPYSKRFEYIEKEKELVEREVPATPYEMAEMQAEFVAGLFENHGLTKEDVMNGIDSSESEVIMDIILYRVLGIKKEEFDVPKMMELLDGEKSTTSS